MCITQNIIGYKQTNKTRSNGFPGTQQMVRHKFPCVWSAHGYTCTFVPLRNRTGSSCGHLSAVGAKGNSVQSSNHQPQQGVLLGYSVSINTKRRRMENSFGVTVLFCIISQAAGRGCCHGDAATEECRRGRRRWQRQEEIQHAQERKICPSGKAD